MERKEKFMPNETPKNIRIYDNEEKTIDRYTVVFTGNYKYRDGCQYIGMSSNPYSPQGFGQHGWNNTPIDYPSYKHLGKKITFDDLPEDCKDLIKQDYAAIWRFKL